MAKFIVIGFPSNDKTVPGEVVYAGNDGSAADEALHAPVEGIVRKSIIRHPVYAKTRHFEAAPLNIELPDFLVTPPDPEAPAPEPEPEAPAEEPEGLAKVIGKKK
jgi:hypothetical protein